MLCRRADRPSALVAPRQETAGDRVVTVVLLLCMLGAVGALIWLVRQPRPVGHGGSDLAVAPPAATEVPVPLPTELDDAAVTDAGVAETPSPADADPVAQAAAEVSEARRTRIREARTKVKVRMYATRWCSICDAARYYLQSTGTDFEELRIDEDRAAAKVLAKLNPQSNVPTFTIGKEVLVGYNPYELETHIDAAARKVAGIPAPAAGSAAPTGGAASE